MTSATRSRITITTPLNSTSMKDDNEYSGYAENSAEGEPEDCSLSRSSSIALVVGCVADGAARGNEMPCTSLLPLLSHFDALLGIDQVADNLFERGNLIERAIRRHDDLSIRSCIHEGEH